MHLAPGTRLGAYEVFSILGARSMREVCRARDAKLKREVAIKVLPDAFLHDPERLARFQREAELLATLNHPNIAAVYGFEETPGGSAIVLELVQWWRRLALTINACFCARVSCFTTYSRARAFPTERNAS